MTAAIEVRGLNELIARMQAYPAKLKAVMKDGIDASLLILWEKVPSYPAPPQNSGYVRTGTLGRTLGSGMSGGREGGQPDIYSTRRIGQGYEGRFGTSLDYAPFVIGDGTQAMVHAGRWWTMATIANNAKEKLSTLWNGIGKLLADFLDRSAISR